MRLIKDSNLVLWGLESIDIPKIKVGIINLNIDKIELINMINKCYKGQNISVNEKDILKWCNHSTYNSRLWIKIEKKRINNCKWYC